MEASQERSLEERANELYWSSDASVNQIAEGLDLSKGALYALIRPLPAGQRCPRCSAEMEYSNRTARDKGYVTCPVCEVEQEVDDTQEARAADVPEAAWAVETVPDPSSRAALQRIVIGSALLGVATGVAIALLARRR